MLATTSCSGHKHALRRPCPAADTAAAVPTWRRGKPSSSRCSRQLRLHAASNASVSTAAVVVPNPQGPGYPAFQAELQLPAGTEAYQVSLKKPLGLTLTGEHLCYVSYTIQKQSLLLHAVRAVQANITPGTSRLCCRHVPDSSSRSLYTVRLMAQRSLHGNASCALAIPCQQLALLQTAACSTSLTALQLLMLPSCRLTQPGI
jgi:hypothetical protein